ncbi:hypothetical protein Hdeb2414_s0007g00228071 [Helianthus debilis subsp. tardiflorus]
MRKNKPLDETSQTSHFTLCIYKHTSIFLPMYRYRSISLKRLRELMLTCCRTDAFKRKTERLVNELKRSAESAEVTLEKIETKADHVLFSSNHIHDSLSSIDIQTQELAQTSKDVEERVVNIVLEHSQTVYKQSL